MTISCNEDIDNTSSPYNNILTLYIGTASGGLHFDCTVQSSELGNEKSLKVGDFRFIVPSGESDMTVAFTE